MAACQRPLGAYNAPPLARVDARARSLTTKQAIRVGARERKSRGKLVLGAVVAFVSAEPENLFN